MLRSGACWVALVCLAALVGCKTAEQKETDKAAAGDLNKLAGAYVVQSVINEADADAEKAPVADAAKEGETFVIEKGILTHKVAGETKERRRLTLEGKDSVDLVYVNDKGETIETPQSKKAMEYRQKGKYKLSGDTLTLTFAAINKDRPTEVNVKGKGLTTLVLRKAKEAGKDEAGKQQQGKDAGDKKGQQQQADKQKDADKSKKQEDPNANRSNEEK